MRYIDTSVLVAYLTPEVHSAAAEGFMLSAGTALAISSWTEVELLSALASKVLAQQLSKKQADVVLEAYTRRVSPCLQYLSVDDDDHRRATSLLKGWDTALRAGDGLHLAMPSAVGRPFIPWTESWRSRGQSSEFLYTLSSRRASRALWIPIKSLNLRRLHK